MAVNKGEENVILVVSETGTAETFQIAKPSKRAVFKRNSVKFKGEYLHITDGILRLSNTLDDDILSEDRYDTGGKPYVPTS